MDIALNYNSSTRTFDIDASGTDLAQDNSLRTAIIISLFTDRRANADDVIPDGTDNYRGWWADAYSDVKGDLIGSRLWLLDREKQTTDVLARAKEYVREALQWLLDDGIATHMSIETEWVQRGVLGILVTLTLANGSDYADSFNYSLES